MSESLPTPYVIKPTSYVAWDENGKNPRVLAHQELICGVLPAGAVRWHGLSTARLPEVDETATELNADGSIPWKLDAKGNRMFRDLESQFPIPNIDTGRSVARQIHECLQVYDELARKCAEEVSAEYAETVKKFREYLKPKEQSKILVPGMAGVVATNDRLVDDNGETIQKP